MLLVGVIEIAAGVLVALRPPIGAYVVALWLWHHRELAADSELLRRRLCATSAFRWARWRWRSFSQQFGGLLRLGQERY